MDKSNWQSLLSTVEKAFGGQGGQPTPRTSLPFGEGHHVFRVDGPITVYHRGSGSISDGIDYRVLWESLDDQGNVIPGFNKLAEDTPPDGGQQRERSYNPPFDNPNGWRVHIKVPPQPEYSGSSNGVYLQVGVSSGALKKEFPSRNR